MAVTTCKFWIKFFAFIFIGGTLGTLLNNYILGFVIAFPIFFIDFIILHFSKDMKTPNEKKEITIRQWIQDNYDMLEKKYVNKFIAFSQEEIIDSDENLSNLKERLTQKYKSIKNITIEFINPREERDYYTSLKRPSQSRLNI